MDSLVVPKHAKDPVLGHLFLDFMLRPKVALTNAEWVGITPPVTGADPTGRFASFTLSQEGFAAGHPILPLSATAQVEWMSVWNDVRETLAARD